jgi:hypothetical protein
VLLAGLAIVVWPASAFGHAERISTWPTYPGSVPQARSSGPTEVVCKPDSERRIQAIYGTGAHDRAVRSLKRAQAAERRYRRLAARAKARGRRRTARRYRVLAARQHRLVRRYERKVRATDNGLARNLALLPQCQFRDIQAAVDAAHNGTRILVLPGVYQELPSRNKPFNDPACANLYVPTADGSTSAPGYAYNLSCPNDRNLIAIMGDTNDDHRCDAKCDLQIVGTAGRGDVLIQGDRKRLNVIRADRADGIYLANFTIEYSDFNNIYVLETNGFHVNNVETRYSREYGVLSFTSEAGLYENIDAHGDGDSGVYPGSGPQGLQSERDCRSYGIEIRNVDSHHNNLGYSGTSGDSVWIHDSKFHDNATGIATDSFAAGHPGAPEHCSKWEHNQIYSNNNNIFTPERQAYCDQPAEKRDPKVLCSAFQVPVGTGMLIAGGNKNILRNNQVWDNWRQGFMLFWVPSYFRGEQDPAKQQDTSFDNQYTRNKMGFRPDGTRAPNGKDFWWDEEGTGNCWSGNVGPNGAAPTSDPGSLPPCSSPNATLVGPATSAKDAFLVPCATWDPHSNQSPPGCDWFTTPPQPQ